MSVALENTRQDGWVALMQVVGERFAARAAVHDADDSFVLENYRELKSMGAFAASIPSELGGGGASYGEIAEMLRTLARYCGSTALALAMHTHLVATQVWRWHRDASAVEKFLRRIVDEKLILISTGASDWLNGSGTALQVDGGFRVTGRKIFGSGVPMGDYLMTGAVYDDPECGPTVLHFPLALKTDGVRILDTWHVMGLRATGSHDVAIEDAFVPDTAIAARRPQGQWHMLIHLAVLVAFPLVYSVYLGIAEAARDIAVERAGSRVADDLLCCLVGEMENELANARLAQADMIAMGASLEPGRDATHRIMTGRTLVGCAAIRTVEKAMEVVGGASLYRDLGLERRFRDIQGARFHPLQQKAQQRYAGRAVLGLPIDG
ncbi:MAG TPA: acyl-CoA dehydrogenase family protein [Acetobacteraceae bacterium]|nr:acyl-CoA dehydrogenase family protein [Acetobacteraceae bacterium]